MRVLIVLLNSIIIVGCAPYTQQNPTLNPTNLIRDPLDVVRDIYFQFTANGLMNSSMGYGAPIEKKSYLVYQVREKYIVFLYFSDYRISTFSLDVLSLIRIPDLSATCISGDACVMIYYNEAAESEKNKMSAAENFEISPYCKAISGGLVEVKSTIPVRGTFNFTCQTVNGDFLEVSGEFSSRF